MRGNIVKVVFKSFCNLLSNRLNKNILTTEDSIRYTFFHSLVTKGGYKPNDIILEHPYKHFKFKDNKLDLYVISKNKKQSLAFEFKYHRGDSGAYTSKAGELFWDIAKLANFNAKGRYIIYITDNKMKEYLSNPRNKLNDLFSLSINDNLTIDRKYIENHSKTLVSWIKSEGTYYIKKCQITSTFQSNLPKKHHLRIYRIKSIKED